THPTHTLMPYTTIFRSRELAPELFMKLARVSSDISRLDEKLRHSIVKSDLVNTLASKESVQSTKIEGTQVTFTDMVNDKHISKQDRKSTRLNSSSFDNV